VGFIGNGFVGQAIVTSTGAFLSTGRVWTNNSDRYAACGFGATNTAIGTVDADGVALAAIQGLNAKLEERIGEQQREITDLRERVSATEGVRAEVALIKAMLAELQRPGAALAANRALLR